MQKWGVKVGCLSERHPPFLASTIFLYKYDHVIHGAPRCIRHRSTSFFLTEKHTGQITNKKVPLDILKFFTMNVPCTEDSTQLFEKGVRFCAIILKCRLNTKKLTFRI